MAVVGKEHLRIGDKNYEFKIRVLKDGLFRAEIPEELVKHATDYRRHYDGRQHKRIVEYECDTKDELIKRLKDLRHVVKESGTVKRKVILYNINIACTVEGPAHLREDYNPALPVEPDERVVILKPKGHYHSDGMKIIIAAEIFIESEITALDGSKRYSYNSSDVPRDERLPSGLYGISIGRSMSRSGPAENRLEWTQERHDFFIRIYEAMGQLAWQLHNLAKPGNIDKAIESGIKLIGDSENVHESI